MATTNNTPIIIVCEDELLHTDDHPQCDDPTCPCHATDGLEVHPVFIEGDEDNPIGYSLYASTQHMYLDGVFATEQEARAFVSEQAERLYTEQGMAASRDSLPFYGVPVLDTTHPPYCNCPACEPDKQAQDENSFL